MKTIKAALIATLAFSSTTLFSARALAGPVWADSVARSHCEYLAMGIGWKESMDMAFSDNSHWASEISSAGKNSSRIILFSIFNRCLEMNNEAFKVYQGKSVI
jgi:hypothetical protein